MTQVSEEKIVEPSGKIAQVLDMVAGMTLLEAAQLVKAFEQKFGVSAAAVCSTNWCSSGCREQSSCGRGKINL